MEELECFFWDGRTLWLCGGAALANRGARLVAAVFFDSRNLVSLQRRLALVPSRVFDPFSARVHSRWASSTMGKYNLTALRVRQTALNQFASGKTKKLPQWVDVVGEIPPSEVLIRNRPIQHEMLRQRMKTLPESSQPQVVFEAQEKRRKPKKPSRLFQPVELKYEEDQLRTEFFRDHPWELARPRVLLETTGKDFENYDWSRIQQPGKRLDGERYVDCLRLAEIFTSLNCH